MKKTKILIPVLTIAGLGATIAPMMTMTSCGHDPKSDVTECELKSDGSGGYIYEAADVLPEGKYKFIKNGDTEGQKYFGFKNANGDKISIYDEFAKTMIVQYNSSGQAGDWITLDYKTGFELTDGCIEITDTTAQYCGHAFTCTLNGEYSGVIKSAHFTKSAIK